MTLDEFNEGFEKFLVVYLRGLSEKESAKELQITRSRYITYTTCVSPEQRLKRRNVMKIKAEAQRAYQAPKPRLNRGELLNQIESLLRTNGVWSSMKSYEHCSNTKLVEVRDRLMRNRSDRYQYSST